MLLDLIGKCSLYLINSPAVRGDNLRFREDGVKELVAKVFLPWYNAYRFFFSQLALLKKVCTQLVERADFRSTKH